MTQRTTFRSALERPGLKARPYERILLLNFSGFDPVRPIVEALAERAQHGVKVHALVDGISGVDIATVLFDLEPDPPPAPAPEPWVPRPEPSPTLLASADKVIDWMAECPLLARR